jgi:hypothetical protein
MAVFLKNQYNDWTIFVLNYANRSRRPGCAWVRLKNCRKRLVAQFRSRHMLGPDSWIDSIAASL